MHESSNIKPSRLSVKIDFCDTGGQQDKTTLPLYQLLQQRYDLYLCDNPDFLFFSHSGHVHRLHTGKRIFFTSESDAPNWKHCDYALTCRHLPDNPRHCRAPFYAMTYLNPDLLIKTPDEVEENLRTKTKFCAFMSSYNNGKTRHRWRFYQKLNARKTVDSAGKANNTLGYTVPHGNEATIEFLRPYKFYMAFENKSLAGYITEKLVQGMAARCVPIYFGCPRVAEEFNPESFINYHDFPSEEALIDYIVQVDQDDALYKRYQEAPFFHDNRPNRYFQPEYYWSFFDRIFTDESPSIASKKSLLEFFIGRWKLAKRNSIR